MKSSIQSKRLQLPNDIEDLVSLLAVGGSGAGWSAGGGGGIGGGGGSPGGGTPGGGGSGGKPGGESVGNNLSFPAIFFDPLTQAALRGDNETFTFTTPTDLNTDYLYFAQGVAGNEWQADSSVARLLPSRSTMSISGMRSNRHRSSREPTCGWSSRCTRISSISIVESLVMACPRLHTR